LEGVMSNLFPLAPTAKRACFWKFDKPFGCGMPRYGQRTQKLEGHGVELFFSPDGKNQIAWGRWIHRPP
jgi:hypothetical protein